MILESGHSAELEDDAPSNQNSSEQQEMLSADSPYDVVFKVESASMQSSSALSGIRHVVYGHSVANKVGKQSSSLQAESSGKLISTQQAASTWFKVPNDTASN